MMKSAEKDEGYKPPWSELCPDMLSLIFSRLSFTDRLSFRGVCNAWRSAGWTFNSDADPQTPLWVMRPMTTDVDNTTTAYNFTDSSTGRSFKLDIPELKQCSILTARGGWLLVRGPLETSSFPIFFLNPFTHEKVFIPDFEIPDGGNGPAEYIWIEFVASPNSPDWVICAIVASSHSPKSIWTKTYTHGEASWMEKRKEVEVPPLSEGYVFFSAINAGSVSPRAGLSWTECIFSYFPFLEECKLEVRKKDGAKRGKAWKKVKLEWPFDEEDSRLVAMHEGSRGKGLYVVVFQNEEVGVDMQYWMWKMTPASPISPAEVWLQPRWATTPFP